MELEVLDVDALRTERLRDRGENSRRIRHVGPYAIEVARVGGVRCPQHPTAVAGSFVDPPPEQLPITSLESCLHVLDRPAVVGERGE